MWIDADAYVNSWKAVELYFLGCENKKLSIATSADRVSRRVLRAEWIFGSFAKIKSQNYKHAKSSGFSEKIAREVALKPHLNAGVFALEADAPHWDVWRNYLFQALKKGKVFGSDQIALNMTVYVDQLPLEILPAYCNWIFVNEMKYDSRKNTCGLMQMRM